MPEQLAECASGLHGSQPGSGVNGSSYSLYSHLSFSSEPTLKLDLIVPRSSPTQQYPLMVFFFSGGFMSGSRHSLTCRKSCGNHKHSKQALENPLSVEALLAANIAVATIDYRLCTGTPNALWPAQLDDARRAVRWLRAHATNFSLNPRRIGCFGMSAGGGLCASLAVSHTAKERLALGVSLSGWTDFFAQEGAPHFQEDSLGKSIGHGVPICATAGASTLAAIVAARSLTEPLSSLPAALQEAIHRTSVSAPAIKLMARRALLHLRPTMASPPITGPPRSIAGHPQCGESTCRRIAARAAAAESWRAPRPIQTSQHVHTYAVPLGSAHVRCRLASGDRDTVHPLAAAEQLAEALRRRNASVTLDVSDGIAHDKCRPTPSAAIAMRFVVQHLHARAHVTAPTSTT